MPDLGVVITAAEDREINLSRTIERLSRCARRLPGRIELPVIVVFDGCFWDLSDGGNLYISTVEIAKHEPGREQPRNVGVRRLQQWFGECTHVWFLDSDLIFGDDVLSVYERELTIDPDRILIGPYEWLAKGAQGMNGPFEMVDPRWASFIAHPADELLVGDLGAALACFGGNLVWPIERFVEIGGFHPLLHHGRCEDGELGLRAASLGVPMSFVSDARAFHVWHPRDLPSILAKNERDVPLINKWHPWVEEQGLVVRAQDGARFNFICPKCGTEVNTLESWAHTATH